jgi:hypothetical protein
MDLKYLRYLMNHLYRLEPEYLMNLKNQLYLRTTEVPEEPDDPFVPFEPEVPDEPDLYQ